MRFGFIAGRVRRSVHFHWVCDIEGFRLTVLFGGSVAACAMVKSAI